MSDYVLHDPCEIAMDEAVWGWPDVLLGKPLGMKED